MPLCLILYSWSIAQDSLSNLDITSQPQGAQIYLDGILSGSTPNILNRVPTGEHTIKIGREGYEDWITVLSVDQVDTYKVHAILNPLRGQIQFNSNVLNAYIYIDGKLVGQTPKLVREIEYGWHYIEVRKTKKENSEIDYNNVYMDTIAIYDSKVQLINAILEDNKEFDDFDPIAAYLFNGNANDESDNGNHGIVHGPSLTSDRNGIANSAYRFDGNNDYIQVPHTEPLNLGKMGQSYSISIWVKSKNPQGKRLIQKWNEHLNTPYPISIQTGFENCVAQVYDGQTKSTMSKIPFGSIWDNHWHHLVIIVNVSNKIVSGYLDGKFIHQVIYLISSSTSNDIDMYIGKSPIHNYFFKGCIDDIRIYNRALTKIEVESLYLLE